MTRAHVDVCSGVGGFSLAARWAGLTTVAHAEIEPYPSAVLARQFPDVPNLGDMRHVTRDALSRLGVDDIFLLTGGIPCQPASCAGRRKGSADARWLWPEFLRLVRGVRPLWLLAENPRGIVTLEPHGLDWICGELEAAGYEVWAAVVGAWAVGAPHKRDRVFIVGRDKDGCMASAMQPRSPSVARPRNHGGEGVSDGRAGADGSPSGTITASAAEGVGNALGGRCCGQSRGRAGTEPAHGYVGDCPCGAVADHDRRTSRTPRTEQKQAGTAGASCLCDQTAGNTHDAGHQAKRVAPREQNILPTSEQSGGREPEPGLGGFAPRLSAGLDRVACWPAGPGEAQKYWEAPRLAKGVPHRTARLKALGNTVVPQQAYAVIRAIVETEILLEAAW